LRVERYLQKPVERAGTSHGKMLFVGVIREHQPTLTQARSWCWNDRQEPTRLSINRDEGVGFRERYLVIFTDIGSLVGKVSSRA
jgi:hypothetical protein